MGVFDIVGPVMIGPSSSHTAGAVRLGQMGRAILADPLTQAAIYLYGSFANTYQGHGTDKALVAGLLGFAVDDVRIKSSLAIAAQSGVKIDFKSLSDPVDHPNTAKLCLTGCSGKAVNITGSSLGGGSIVVNYIDDFAVEITGNYYTLLTVHQDQPGVIAAITKILAQQQVNIAYMKVSRKQKGMKALMILEADQAIPTEVLAAVKTLAAIELSLLVDPL